MTCYKDHMKSKLAALLLLATTHAWATDIVIDLDVNKPSETPLVRLYEADEGSMLIRLWRTTDNGIRTGDHQTNYVRFWYGTNGLLSSAIVTVTGTIAGTTAVLAYDSLDFPTNSPGTKPWKYGVRIGGKVWGDGDLFVKDNPTVTSTPLVLYSTPTINYSNVLAWLNVSTHGPVRPDWLTTTAATNADGSITLSSVGTGDLTSFTAGNSAYTTGGVSVMSGAVVYSPGLSVGAIASLAAADAAAPQTAVTQGSNYFVQAIAAGDAATLASATNWAHGRVATATNLVAVAAAAYADAQRIAATNGIGLTDILRRGADASAFDEVVTLGGGLTLVNGGAFNGSGAALSDLNASALASGTVAAHRLGTNTPSNRMILAASVSGGVTNTYWTNAFEVIAGANITTTTNGSGQVTVASTASGGGSPTPWTSNIDAAGFGATNMLYYSLGTNSAHPSWQPNKMISYVLDATNFVVFNGVTSSWPLIN